MNTLALSNFSETVTIPVMEQLPFTASALSFGAGNGSTVTFTLTDMPASRTNYLLNSQNPSLWSISNVIVTPGISDSLGGFNASTITATASSGFCQGPSFSSVPASICCSSIWARRRTGSGVVYLVYPSGFGLVPIALTPAWQRFSIIGPVIAGFAYCEVYLSTVGDAVDIAFGQVEPGTTPTDYIPTTTAPVTVTANGVAVVPNGSPSIYRNDYQGIQPLSATPRTNLLLYSQAQNNAVYTGGNFTLTAGIADPAGGATALTVTATANNGYFYQTVAVYSGPIYTNSLWARRRNGTGPIYIYWPNGGSSVLALSGSWQRFSASSQSGTGADAWGIQFALSGDAIDIAFGQVEQSPAPTSYIPTTNAPVTMTDYTLTGNTVTLAVAPLLGAALTWSGNGTYLGPVQVPLYSPGSAWDLGLDGNGNIASVSGPSQIAQDVASAIQLFLGELYYDVTLGLPWLSEVMAKPYAPSILQPLLEKAALSIAGVDKAKAVISGTGIVTSQPAGFNVPLRKVTGYVEIMDATGQKLGVNF